MKITILLLCVLMGHVGHVFGHHDLLYPHMAGNGDTEFLPRCDDCYNDVNLNCSYWFYGKPFNDVFVSSNGYVTTDEGWATYVPHLMSSITTWSERLTMMAPLFSDNMHSDPPDTDHIWFRETTDPDLLLRAQDDISPYFERCGGHCFEPTCLFIVTWQRLHSWCEITGLDWRNAEDHVKPSRDQQAKHEQFNQRSDHFGNYEGSNGYQLVLATDGLQAFAMYNIHTIEWSACWDWNTSGFSAGDGINSCDLPGSGDASIANLALDTNVDKVGRWIYRVDLARMLDPECNMCM